MDGCHGHRLLSRLVNQETIHINPSRVTAQGLKAHHRRHSFHELSALGIEVGIQFLQLLFRTLLHAVVHLVVGDAPDRVVCTQSFTVDGEGSREIERLVVERQHPFCVGPHFVVASEESLCQRYLSVGTSVFNLQYLSLVYVSELVYQLHIERFADVCRLQLVGFHDVGLIPDGVALVVACVVEMHVDLLLGPCVGECLSLLEILLKRVFRLCSRFPWHESCKSDEDELECP